MTLNYPYGMYEGRYKHLMFRGAFLKICREFVLLGDLKFVRFRGRLV